LMILAVYYLFFNKTGDKKKMRLSVCAICIVVSAVCDGLFGICGPLMVLYFLSVTESTYEYLGTLQLFFTINSVYNTIFRFAKGI
ncbi:MAG: sulfite exporter TauE/SafE family protein, partial [Lachnospiraceae bacterium]|nr:sulfite exporter TauE/SafE family protein [Lachnospiraceae bacterium]